MRLMLYIQSAENINEFSNHKHILALMIVGQKCMILMLNQILMAVFVLGLPVGTAEFVS